MIDATFDSVQDIVNLTVETTLLVSDNAHINACELRNQVLQQGRLARVCDDNGVTLPATAKRLRADAARSVRHSRTSARNIKQASGIATPAQADAHHLAEPGPPPKKQRPRG